MCGPVVGRDPRRLSSQGRFDLLAATPVVSASVPGSGARTWCDVTRFAVDVAPVVGIDVKGNKRFASVCGPLLEKPIEQPFPRRRMHLRRLGQHAV